MNTFVKIIKEVKQSLLYCKSRLTHETLAKYQMIILMHFHLRQKDKNECDEDLDRVNLEFWMKEDLKLERIIN